MQTLLDNPFIFVYLEADSSLMVARWKPETENLREEEYRDIMQSLVEFIKVYQIKKWLGLTQDFNYTIVPDLQDWTASEITPGLAEAGLQKMALLIPHELVANLAVQQTVDEMEAEGMSYETKYFDDEAQARAWLNLAH